MTSSADILGFLADNAARVKKLMERRDTSIGFNAFALVSDTYYRENFHSDILAAILDPSSPHGEGKLFLRLFLEYLVNAARTQGKASLADSLAALPLDGEIRVAREEGRIDIKIQAPGWTIIIENKINDAVDQPKQLPNYLQKCGGPDRVKAVVYLTRSEEKTPGDDWSPDERVEILPRLVRVVGFTETKSVPNLVDGWLAPCELAAKGFAARAVLAQYSELVRHQAGETMNQDDFKGLFKSFADHGIGYGDLMAVLGEAPHALAGMIIERAGEKARVKRAWPWKPPVAVLELQDLHPAGNPDNSVRFAIDVHCEKLDVLGISFVWRGEDPTMAQLQAYERLLKTFDASFGYDKAIGRLLLPINTNEAFRNVEGFLAKIDALLAFLDKNWKRFEEIAGEPAT